MVAHFFRRSFGLIRKDGMFGLIATKTICQGDTRASGLSVILIEGGAIVRAMRRLKWPGDAAVTVSVVHVVKGEVRAPLLDAQPVRRVSAYLVEGDLDASPATLSANKAKAFQGSIVLGVGFTFDDEAAEKGESLSLADMQRLIKSDSRNGDRIHPFLGGEEINSDPRHAHFRYAIDFFDRPLGRRSLGKKWSIMTDTDKRECRTRGLVPPDYPDEVAEDWPDLIEIVRQFVKPYRDVQKRQALKERWWQYADKRPGLYRAVAQLSRVLVMSQTTKHIAVAFVSSHLIYSHKVVVFAISQASALACIQASSHQLWALSFGSSLEDRPVYTPSDCFETFPLPLGIETSPAVEAAGQVYHDHRAALMVARNEGMTKTYNRFHDPTEIAEDIQRLRELHAAMDRAVLEAYGWRDLAARAASVFLDETNEDNHTYQRRLFWPSDFRDEVLARLLALNAERHADEARRGIAPGMKGKAEADEEDELGEE